MFLSSFILISSISLEPCSPSKISSVSLGIGGIFVNWTEIDNECKNGIIIGHVLYIYQLHDNGTMTYIRTDYQWDGTVTVYTMKNVSHGINYVFAVAGINGAGAGANSSWEVRSVGRISK